MSGPGEYVADATEGIRAIGKPGVVNGSNELAIIPSVTFLFLLSLIIIGGGLVFIFTDFHHFTNDDFVPYDR